MVYVDVFLQLVLVILKLTPQSQYGIDLSMIWAMRFSF